MYRAQGSSVQPIDGPAGQSFSQANAIDNTSTLIGYTVWAPSRQSASALRYTDALGIEFLNQLVPAGSDWNLDPQSPYNNGDYLASATATNGIQIVGYGLTGNGVVRGYSLTPGTSGAPGSGIIKQIPMPPDLPEAYTTYGHGVVANGVNDRGEVVGAVYDPSLTYPEFALIWVDGVGTVDLNQLIDPASGWVLNAAYAINHNRQVTGFGYLNGQGRAFEMTVPDLSPCPVDACHVSTRSLRDNSCPTATLLTNIQSCAEGLTLRLDGVADVGGGKFVAVFGFNNSSGAPVQPTSNVESIGGVTITNPQPPPPGQFPPGDHPGAFLPTFSDGQTITWTVDGETVSASASLPLLPVVPIGQSGKGVQIGTTLVTLVADVNQYKVAPSDPTAQAEPALNPANEFFGILKGDLTVSPSGAAVFTVPIGIPPGIAGMAPNLNLVYNSQGGDGIAGQGWDLTGLSVIHRCAKTRVQDGHVRPVVMDELIKTDGTETDGLCLDGQRLFEDPVGSGSYRAERTDFSVIKMAPQKDHFFVRTKSGETRFYGHRPDAKVQVPRGTYDPTTTASSGVETAVWALSMVADPWGNYYDIHYNSDAFDPLDYGFVVSQINMGHWTNTADLRTLTPFTTVNVNYEERQDVRHSRIGAASLPRKWRLKNIGSEKGTYAFSYMDYDPLLPSRLQRIDFCAPGAPCNGPSGQVDCSNHSGCLAPLTFNWDWGTYGWHETTPDYAMPASTAPWLVETGGNGSADFYASSGTQFVDLDGDGRLDLVAARQGFPIRAWQNTGRGWAQRNDWAPPGTLMTSGGGAHALMPDLNNDGLPDFVNDGFAPPEDHNAWINALHGPISMASSWAPLAPPRYTWTFLELPFLDFDPVTPRWHLNDQGQFQIDPQNQSDPSDLVIDHMIDLNGDGRADLLRTVKLVSGLQEIHTAINTPDPNTPGQILWAFADGGTVFNTQDPTQSAPASRYDNFPADFDLTKYVLEDINRDGLIDLVSIEAKTRNGVLLYDCLINVADPALGDVFSYPDGSSARTAWKRSYFAADAGANTAFPVRQLGDVDGDGLYDAVVYAPFSPPVVSGMKPIAFATGTGYTSQGGDGYLAALAASTPPQNPSIGGREYAWSLIDLNADGLVDLVRNHHSDSDQGQVYINTGTAWVDLHGSTTWTQSAGTNPVPAMPIGTFQSDDLITHQVSFVDLNGDGVTDLVAGGRAWLNTFRPPVINRFPNGLANQTDVSYEVITTADAVDHGVYDDDGQLAPGTKRMIAPLRVVGSLTADVGPMPVLGGPPTTMYRYTSMRGSASDRGPQGFQTVRAFDVLSGWSTETTFAQAYPYTGMPVSVVRAYLGEPLVETTTEYCDTALGGDDGTSCAPITGKTYPPGTSLFIHPRVVTDKTHAVGSSAPLQLLPDDLVTTTTTFHYDALANPNSTSVSTSTDAGGGYLTVTTNTYGDDDDSEEQKQGKVTRSSVRYSVLEPFSLHEDPSVDPVEHTTGSVYRSLPSGVSVVAVPLVLDRTKIEPDSTQPGIRLDTAYGYDDFGNVVTSTSCANDFDGCSAGASGPPAGPDAPDPLHLPFRTSTASYDPIDFRPAPGLGLTTSLSYARGRFPVKVTNALGHTEYSVYDPVTGLLKEKTGPNGITTCHGYDAFGNLTSETQRCGSSTPLVTTTHKYTAQIQGGNPTVQIATLERRPDGSSNWSYADRLGRPILMMSHSFEGGFTKTAKTYDSQGRLYQVSKPFAGHIPRGRPGNPANVVDADPGPRSHLLDDDGLRRDRSGRNGY